MEEKDRTELFSRRIAEDVSKSVEASLRRRYSWIGMITAFILGGLGYGLITSVIRDANDSVARSEVLLDNMERQLVKADERTEDKLAELDQFVETSAERLKAFDERIEATALRVEERMQTVDALLSARERDLENLGDTAQRIEDLSTQVAELNGVVVEIAQGMEDAPGRLDAPAPGYAAALTRQTGEIAEIRKQAKEVVQRIKTSRTSVFVHLSPAGGVRPEEADMLVKELESLGYTVPDTRAVANVRPLNQVRFYYEEDRAAADQLALDTAQVLAALGADDAAVQARDFTHWQDVKPRPGVLELWL